MATLAVKKRIEKSNDDMFILGLIKEKKHILFGSFSSTVSKVDKRQVWKEILEECQSRNLTTTKDAG